MSLGTDVGTRETIFHGKSDLSGDYIVEEIKGVDNKIFRRLIFLSNQFVIQSEALVKVGMCCDFYEFRKEIHNIPIYMDVTKLKL